MVCCYGLRVVCYCLLCVVSCVLFVCWLFAVFASLFYGVFGACSLCVVVFCLLL